MEEILKAKQLAFKRMERREYSSRDLLKYLTAKGVTEETAYLVLTSLSELGMVSDARFSKMLARDQGLKGKGPHFLRQKLKEKGIHLSIEEVKALSEDATQTTELKAAQLLVQRKFTKKLARLPDGDPDETPEARRNRFAEHRKQRHKALQTLLRRGFSYTAAKEALETEE